MAYLINTFKRYKYEPLVRLDLPTGRKYVTPEGTPLPSVTTVLDRTKDKSHLEAWAKSVGPEEADRIKNEAALVGTHMHGCLERFIKHRPIEVPTSWLAVRGYRMAMTLAEKYFPNLNEVWGCVKDLPCLALGRVGNRIGIVGISTHTHTHTSL